MDSKQQVLVRSETGIPEYIQKDTMKWVYTDVLVHYNNDTRNNLHKDTLKRTLSDSLVYHDNATMENLHTDTAKSLHTDTAVGLHTDTPNGFHEDTFKDLCTYTFMDSYKDLSKNDGLPESEKIYEAKRGTAMDANMDTHCEEDRTLLNKTTSRLQDGKSQNRQEICMHESRIWSHLGLMVNFVVIAPLVVVFWNTTWSLFDHFLLSNNCKMSAWASAAIGFPVMASVTYLQNSLHTCATRCNWPTQAVISRGYTYLVSLAYVSQWRSVWMLAHCYIGRTLLTSGLSFLVACLLLILLRCLVSVAAPPVSISMDVSAETYYKIPMFWESQRINRQDWSSKFVVNTFLTVCVVQVAVSTYWRSAWAILDLCFIPEEQLLSALYSIGIGLVLSCLLLVLQAPTAKLYKCLHTSHWCVALVCHDLVTLLYSIVCVTFWRGVWMLVNLYLPCRPYGLFVAHGSSYGILVICLAGNSLLVRHIGRDGGRGLSFDTRYMSTLVETFRYKGRFPDATKDRLTPEKMATNGPKS